MGMKANISVSKNGKVFIQNSGGAGIWVTTPEMEKLVSDWTNHRQNKESHNE